MEVLLSLALKVGLRHLLHFQSRWSLARREHILNIDRVWSSLEGENNHSRVNYYNLCHRNLCLPMEVETLVNKFCVADDESVERISILVVDDDVTCLSIVSMMLKKWKYQVVTVKHPMDALSTLRIKGRCIDLVIADVHMPDMSGLELQQVIAQEFELPVVLMSADDREGTILEGLKGGAAFFIVKPISLDDLRDLWQYTALQRNKKGKNVVLKEIDGSEKSSNCFQKSLYEFRESAPSISENGCQEVKQGKSKRRSAKEQGDADKDNNADSDTPVKKAKVVWTDSLHNKFLEAIREIGFDKAAPKKILDLMNVTGLTRENVSSHLQKYRIFLQKVSDASSIIQTADRSLARRAIQSNIASKGLSNFSQFHQEISGSKQKLINNSSNPNSVIDTYHGGLSFTQQARNHISLSGYGQPELVRGEDNLANTRVNIENLLYRANQLSIPMEANKNQIRSDDISTQLMSGNTSTQVGARPTGNPANRLSGRNLLALGTNGIATHTTLKGNLNFLHNGIADDQRFDAEKLSNFTQNKDAEEASDFLAGIMEFIGKGHDDSDQRLAQEASSLVGLEGEKLFPTILSDHIDEKTWLPSFVIDVGRGEEVGAVLDPVCNFSVFHNINAKQESRGFGDLGSSFLNQVNRQTHQQQDHIGLTESAEDGVSQLHDVFFSPAESKDEEFLELMLASSPSEDDQNLDGV